MVVENEVVDLVILFFHFCCKTVSWVCINKTMIWIIIRDLQNLFPSKLHAVIFVAYMGLFINQGKVKSSETIIQL